MAIERTTSIPKIEVISRGGHLACKILRVVESLILVSVLNRFLVHELVSRLYKTRAQTNGTTINNEKCTSNMMQNMYDMEDMICGMRCGMQNARYDRKCMNLASTWKTKCATGNMR